MASRWFLSCSLSNNNFREDQNIQISPSEHLVGKIEKLAIFTTPKPFIKALTQFRALESWINLRVKVDLYLVLSGDSNPDEIDYVSHLYNAKIANIKLDSTGMPLVGHTHFKLLFANAYFLISLLLFLTN